MTPPATASTTSTPLYLEPYAQAAARHGASFSSLLWASQATQAARFDVFAHAIDLNNRSILDLGCGRADFLDYLLDRDITPAHYVGLEAIEALASAAQTKQRPRCQIIQADFVREPQRMFVGADIVVISGALNTLGAHDFYQTIRRAFDAAAEVLMFNFLDSPQLAGASYLNWHSPQQVGGFCRSISPHVRELDGYLNGDRTMVLAHDRAN